MAKILHVCTNYNLIAEIMASSEKRKKLNDETNGTRLSRLLVNKGTKALKQTFDKYHPPSQLQTVLNTKQAFLQTLRRRIINDDQWNLLYSASGNPDSKEFDITLLSVLLRNICNLKPPATGWSTMPLETDRSEEANLLRIKLYRNKILAHAPSTEVSDSQFHDLWPKISKTLQDLGIQQAEIDELKTCHLSPEEENYIEILKDWKLEEDKMHEILDEVNVKATKLLTTTEEIKESIPQNSRELQESIDNRSEEIKESIAVQANEIKKSIRDLQSESSSQVDADDILLKLCKFTFDGDIRNLVDLWYPGTREWLYTKVYNWFSKKKSKIFVLTAGPGVGKSVLAAKVIDAYIEKESLAACHFCKFNDSSLSNPLKMIQSLANQMCDSVKGFKDKLLEQLKRPNTVKNLQDAFRVYLKEPLQHLPENKPMLVVIDGLDECESDQRIELLNVLANEFSKLPPWVKVLVTSRPEMNVLEKLNSLEYMEIATDKNNEEDTNNEEDIKLYLRSHLPTISERKGIISFITKFCEGSFLFASYLQKHLHNCKAKITKTEIKSQLPRGISSVYQGYFARLQEELEAVCEEYDIFYLLEIIAAAHGAIPLSFITEGIQLNQSRMKDIIVKNVSTLLYVNNDLVTVFHKSVVDWLKLTGDKKHKYTVDCERGNQLLWNISKNRFEEIKKTILDQKYRPIIDELKRNKAMKYAIENGINHLQPTWSKIVDYEWLADVVILHVLFEDAFHRPFRLFNQWKLCIEIETASDNTSMTRIKEKISWHYNHFTSLTVEPVYVQEIFNKGPSKIFSDEEKYIAKNILNHHVRCWFEELNPLHCTPNINVTACAFSPDGSHLVSCATDGKIHIWNINPFDVVKEVSSDCEHAICCFWTDEISIFRHVGSDLVLLKYRVNQDSNVEVNKMTKETFGTDKTTPLAFSPKAFIYRCANDSKIKVQYFDGRNEIPIPIPELNTMEKFAVSRDGLLIIAANKENFEIWKINGNTPTKCHLAKSDRFLEKAIYKCCKYNITTFGCSIPCDENYGIISCLCSQDHHEEPEPHMLFINTESGRTILTHPAFSSMDWYPPNAILAVDKINETFLCQSGKRIAVYLIGIKGPLAHFEHNGYPDYYKVGSICRSDNIIALPQKSGGICLVKLHLPR